DMVREFRASRQQGTEFDQPPLVEIKAPANVESYKDAKQSARDYTLTRQTEEKARLMAQGFSEADADALAMQCSQEPLQRTGNFYPGVSGFCGISLRGNPDGHGKAPIRQSGRSRIFL